PALRIGWRVVNGISQAEVTELVHERARRKFSSLPEFLARTRLRPTVLRELALAEAFGCFGYKQREALWEILGHATVLRPEGLSPWRQLNLFSSLESAKEKTADLFQPLDRLEEIRADYQSYGLSVRGHPMQALRTRAAELGIKAIPQLTTGRARSSRAGAQ